MTLIVTPLVVTMMNEGDDNMWSDSVDVMETEEKKRKEKKKENYLLILKLFLKFNKFYVSNVI